MKEIIFLLVLLAISQSLSAQTADDNQDLTRTFNFAENLKAAKQTAKDESKPVIIIIHSTECPACARLRSELVESDDMKLASKKFVMVNACNKQEPDALRYIPEHKYVPRILFLGCNGKELPITNARQKRYTYYYPNANDIVKSMNSALELNHELGCEN